MDFGSLISRAWRITWKYKALWILGIFAGVSGCQPGGGGSGSSGSRWTSGQSGSDPFSNIDMAQVERLIPIVLSFIIGLAVVGLIWFIIGVAARGGLIYGVDAVEQRGSIRAGEAWGAGWHRWGRLFLIDLVLRFSIGILVLALIAAMLVPLIGALSSGQEPRLEMFGPLLGGACIGFPLLVVLGWLLDVLALVAARYAVIGDRPAFDAIGAAWKAFRARFKDHFLMYLIGGVLNFAASLVIAIPIALVWVAVFVPAAISMRGEFTPESLIGPGVLAVGLTFLIGMLYSAIWGTFSSAFWTLFFRRLTGLEVRPAAPVYAPAVVAPQTPSTYPASAPGYPPSQPAPQPTAPPVAPPVTPPAEQPAPEQPTPEQPAPQPPAPPAPPVAPEPPADV